MDRCQAPGGSRTTTTAPWSRCGLFSPEFGVAAGLPQYSGGLGVLAGDHLKAADALGLPLVGVGLFYHHGYFRQQVDDPGGRSRGSPARPRAMALEMVEDVTIVVDIAGVPVHARCGAPRSAASRSTCSTPTSTTTTPMNRLTCDRLYGGGVEERIRQEIVLGVGGVRALGPWASTPRCST